MTIDWKNVPEEFEANLEVSGITTAIGAMAGVTVLASGGLIAGLAMVALFGFGEAYYYHAHWKPQVLAAQQEIEKTPVIDVFVEFVAPHSS